MTENGKLKTVLLILFIIGLFFIAFNWVRISSLFNFGKDSSDTGIEIDDYSVTGRVVYIGEDELVLDDEGLAEFKDSNDNIQSYRKGTVVTNAKWFEFDAGLVLADQTGSTYFGYIKKKVVLTGNAEIVGTDGSVYGPSSGFAKIEPDTEVVVHTKENPNENEILNVYRIELRE